MPPAQNGPFDLERDTKHDDNSLISSEVIRPRIVVIGGGIAGVSVAYYLAKEAEVTLLEGESALAYHATGRSAALMFENYGAPSIRPLSKASRTFLENPPPGLTDAPLLSERGVLTVAPTEKLSMLQTIYETGRATGVRQEWLDTDEAIAMCPALEPGHVAGAVWEPDAKDIDVAALHQAFVRGIRKRGGQILTRAPVTKVRHLDRSWILAAGDLELPTDIVVNAAGAWGDTVAEMAGVAPLGIQPRRRSVFMTPAPESCQDWPLVFDIDDRWYFKPDGTQLLCSPADQTLVEPGDARPDEIAIALAIERINEATTLGIRTVRSTWAGLRTFAPDGGMAIGFDSHTPSFFWLVGQGGTGIQTSPGAGRLAASLILNGEPPDDIPGLEIANLAPTRF